jgi:hypothetical protein
VTASGFMRCTTLAPASSPRLESLTRRSRASASSSVHSGKANSPQGSKRSFAAQPNSLTPFHAYSWTIPPKTARRYNRSSTK